MSRYRLWPLPSRGAQSGETKVKFTLAAGALNLSPGFKTPTHTFLFVYLCVCSTHTQDFSPPGYSTNGISQARILEWVAISSSSESSQLRDQTQVSCIAGGLFISWATREAQFGDVSGKEPAYQCRRHKRLWFDPWVGKIPWRRAWQPTPVFLSGESHGQRSLVGYGP